MMASLYTYLLLMSKHFKLTNWRDFSFLVLTQDFYLTYIIDMDIRTSPRNKALVRAQILIR
jgi:hypothetical protein